jgi:hypothetical protein
MSSTRRMRGHSDVATNLLGVAEVAAAEAAAAAEVSEAAEVAEAA